MINPSSKSFLVAGIYSNVLASTFAKKINVLFIMQDHLRIDLETYRAKIVTPINQSQLRPYF